MFRPRSRKEPTASMYAVASSESPLGAVRSSSPGPEARLPLRSTPKAQAARRISFAVRANARPYAGAAAPRAHPSSHLPSVPVDVSPGRSIGTAWSRRPDASSNPLVRDVT